MSRIAARIVVLVAGVMVVAVLAAAFDPVALFNDTFQQVSVTRNLLAGRGLTTSTLYYDQQYAAGLLPAPQTVWPPGAPLTAAALGLLGVDVRWAMFVVAATALLACPLLAARALRLGGATQWPHLLLALLPLVTAGHWYFTIRGGSETPFIAGTLLALVGVAMPNGTPPERRSRIFAIALGATIALLFRYTGMFMLAALTAYFVCESFVERSRRSLWDGGAALLVPGLVFGLMIARNLVYAGNLSGGVASNETTPLIELLAATASAAVTISGFSTQSLPALLALAAIAALVAASLARAIWQSARLVFGASRDAAHDAPSVAVRLTLLCLLYTAISVTGLIAIGSGREAGALVARYFYPLVPFVAIACAMAWRTPSGRPTDGSSARRMVRSPAVVAFVAALVLAGQGRSLTQRIGAWRTALAANAVQVAAVAAPFDGMPLIETLRQPPQRPVLSSSSQVLGGLFDLPVLGLAPRIYSARRWTAEEVRALVEQYDVCHVLLYPRDTEGAGDGREFFRELREGRRPSWLEPLRSSPELSVFVVSSTPGCLAGSTALRAMSASPRLGSRYAPSPNATP